MTLPSPAEALRARDALVGLGIIAEASGANVTTTDPRSVDRPEDVVRAMVAADCPPRGLAVAADSLETHFLAVTGGTP